MPEQQSPMNMSRLVTTAELARFETCRLAWWYDRTHPLAHAAPPEITRRLDLFEAVYGPGVRDLPEYQLLTHLRDQAQATPASTSPKQPVQLALPADRPRRLVGCVLCAACAIIALLLIGIILSLTRL